MPYQFNIVERIQRMNAASAEDLHKEKICLIEDIFKIEKLLYGFQIPGHDQWLTSPGALFTTLYDMDMEDLRIHYHALSAEMSQYARKLAGF